MTTIGTLAVKFERVDLVLDRAVLRTQSNGPVQARRRRTSVVTATGQPQGRVWSARSSLGTEAEYASLLAAWRLTGGGVRRLDWTPPDEADPIEVHLREFQSQPIGGLYVLTARIEEHVR